MVKKIHLLKFHKNVDEIENIVFGDSDTEGDRSVAEVIFSDDTIFDLKGKIYRATGIYPPHSYIWFDVKPDRDTTIQTLNKMYYSSIKFEDNTWLSKSQLEHDFKRLGLGSIDELPEPMEEGRYKFVYFQREDVLDIVEKRMTVRNVGCYVDNRGQHYNAPINPFGLNATEDVVKLSASSNYSNMLGCTLDSFGDIVSINVVDVKNLPGDIFLNDPKIRSRYSPQYTVEPEVEKIEELYDDVIYPKFDFVSGYRRIPVERYTTDTKTDKIYICLNDLYHFPKHIDVVTLFNNLKSSEDIPYIEIIDPISGEKIHKIRMRDSDSIPVINENDLRKWVERKVVSGDQNYLTAKILIETSSTTDNYANLKISNRGLVELELSLINPLDYATIKDGWDVVDKILDIVDNDIINFMNVGYHTFVNNNMKLDNSTLTLNRIPKSLPALIPQTFENRLEYYNKIFRTSDVSIGLNRKSEIDGNYFPFFINCMYPFVHIEDTRLTKNSEVLFRNDWRDKFNLSGVVYNVLINGKYDIIRNTDGDVVVGDVLLKKTTDVIWNVTDVSSKITLINVRKSDGRVMDRREITRAELKDYYHFYSTVEPYNISNDKSAEYNRKIQLRWKRVNNYVRLSNLGEAIKEYIKNGYLKPEDKGSKHDMQIRRTLQVSHGGISASELDRYIQDVGRTTDLTERNSGISISINLRPSVNIRSVVEDSGEEDFVRDYVYEIKLTEVDDLSKVGDITDFINTLFFTYDKFIDTYTVDKDGRRILRVDEIGDDFVEFMKEYDLPITYDAENGITCRTFTKGMLKDLTDDTDSETDESEDDDDIVLAKANDNFEDEDDEFSDDDLWGNAFGNPDDDEEDLDVEESKIGGPELDEKVSDKGLNEEIEFKFPQANNEFKDADAWVKHINAEKEEVMFYDKIGKFKRDDRMRDEIILSKLYERDPVLFKWERVGFEPFSRLCQPTDRYPVLLNEVEKRELDDKIKKGLSDDYTPEDANDCSVENEDSSDYERCGAIKYGSDEANWFICPKIWCPACKISITEDNIVDDDRCPFCNRVVIDRSKWYLSDTAVAKRAYKAKSSDELSFKKGTKIDKIIRYEGDMCYGIINKKTGLFPKSHITIKRSYGWPGFERSSKHPKNLWVPCCFNSTLDGNAKEQIVERIKTAYGIKTKNSNKKNPYIIKVGKRKQKILEISRLGALPDNLNALFKAEGVNTENIAMLPNDHVEGFNMFFRVGAGNSFETRDFLSLIANIYGNVNGDDDYDRYQLINDIIDKITPEIFSRCNRGVLEILFKDIRDDVISSFQNFIEYLLSNEPKNYRYLWDLCTRPGFLFERGINLVLVDTDDKDVNVICPPFPTDVHNSREYVLAIKYESSEGSIFEPVYNVSHKNKVNDKIVVMDDNFNPGYDVIKGLHDRLRKCGTTPNYGLLKDIYENKGVVATPQAFPLYPAKLIDGMLSSKGYTVQHIRNEYNKVTGLCVSGLDADGTPSTRKDGSSIDIFIPVYPSGAVGETITMGRARETFTDFLNTFYFLRKIYSDVVKKEEDDIIRINVLPTEVIIQDDMIVAVVTNSNSIVPIKPTEIDMSYITDGVYKFTGIDGKKYELPRSSRKYYAKLDTYIRNKPIGILKYSKEISLRGIMNIPEMNVKQVILDKEIFVVFDIDSKNILIPFSPTDLNMSIVKSLDSSLVESTNIFEWVQSNGITDYKLGDVIENLSGLWKRFDIPTRPARYILCPTDGLKKCDAKNVIGLVLETGLQVPVMEMNIIEANKLDMTPYIPDKYSRDKMDYYIDSSQKDKRMRQIAKLEYEEELFNIIKYEFSKYLQTETGANVKQELQSVLDNVFDLIHTRVAREKIYNILDDFLKQHSIERLHSKNAIHKKRMEMKLENYNVPSFRQHYTDKDDADCEKNPHYTYDNRWRKTDGRRRRINKCKIIIPRENLIHDDIADNKRNKIYRIVDEIIRDKTIRMEILDGLVPKSTTDVKYRPIDGGEVIYSSSELEDDTYIALYKRDVSQNLRRDEFGEVIPDFDSAQPEEVVGDFQSEKKMGSMTYLADVVLEVEIRGTGKRETLF